MTNASGAVVERYEYGPFGEPTILDPAGAVREASAIGNHYLWNGREYDPETGLYYYRLRYLDPELGRFTTLDPIGLWGDPNNLGNGYAYVGNRPWTGLDPYGLLTAEGVWEGVRSIPRGIVEPVLLAADIATAFGVGINNAAGGEYIFAEDVQFSSSTANRHRQSIIDGDGAGSHVWVGAITATAMPTGGFSLLLDAMGRAWNSSPEEADRILSNFVGAHTTATVAGVGFTRLQATRETCPAGGASTGREVAVGGKSPRAPDVPPAANRTTDFIADSNGTIIPTSQSTMRAGFEAAGFPSKPTSSPGIQYTLPSGMTVRIMEPAGQAPLRASFENANGGAIDPFTGKPPQPPRLLSRPEKREYVRNRTHVELGR